MAKAILADTPEQARNILDTINSTLGLPNHDTGTIDYCNIEEHKNRTQWIVLVPEDSELYRAMGDIVDIDLMTDRYFPPMPGMFPG